MPITTSVELAVSAAKRAAEFGVAVKHGYAEPFAATNTRPFDAAALVEVLDYVPDPVGLLRTILRLVHTCDVLVMGMR